MEETSHRIAFAWLLRGWSYNIDSINTLRNKAEPITPEEYDKNMKGNLFCPTCSTPLLRVPEDTDVFSNSRRAHFRHKSAYRDIPCALRTVQAQGLRYKNEETAKKAIEDENLVVVSDWMEIPPSQTGDITQVGKYNQTAIEDENGPETEVAIGRHIGQTYSLPSKITSVTALCRDFDKNLLRGYHFPGNQYALLLRDQLFNIEHVDQSSTKGEAIFFGRVTEYRTLDARNIIYVRNRYFRHMKMYTWPEFDERKNISSESVGRVVVFVAQLEWGAESVPRCFMNSWGKYSLLPEKYEKLLPR